MGSTSMSQQRGAATARAEPDTSTWLTCAQASDLLAVSENTIRTWKRNGRLTPRTAPRTQPGGTVLEVQVYDPRELTAMGARGGRVVAPGDAGELAARAFELFDDGVPLRRVVTRLRETPARITELHDQWTELGGADLVVTEAARAELERFVGPFADVAGLVERVRATLGMVVEIRPEGKLASASEAEIEGAILAAVDHLAAVSPAPRRVCHPGDQCDGYPTCESCGPPRI
jgi:hypothetical protein